MEPDLSDPPTFERGESPLTADVMRRLLRQQIYFAVLIGAVLWFVFAAAHVIPLLIFAFLFAYLLGPLVGLITRDADSRRGFSRTGAILTVYAVLILLLGGAGWLIAGRAASEITALTRNYPELRQDLIQQVHLSEKSWPLDALPQSARQSIDNTINNLDHVVGQALRRLQPLVVQRVPGLVELLVIPILAYYLLKDGRRFINYPRDLLREDQRERYDRLVTEIDASLRGYLKGQLTLSAVAAVLVFAILTIFRVHYAYLVAISAFFLEFVPVVGPLLWALVSVLLTYIQYPDRAVFVLILVTLAHQFDMHILAPKILGGHLRLHPAVVIVALVSGNAAFGLLGALLAAPAAALLTITLRYLIMDGALSRHAVLRPTGPAPPGRIRSAITGRIGRDRAGPIGEKPAPDPALK